MNLRRISLRSIFLIFFCVVLFFSLWMTSPDLKNLVYRATKLGSHLQPVREDTGSVPMREGEPIVNRTSVKIEPVQETRSVPSSLKSVSEVSRLGSPGPSAEVTTPSPATLGTVTTDDSVEQATPDDTTKETKRAYYSLHIGSFQNFANARKRVELLSESGLPAWWKGVAIPGKGKWFRVYIGKHRDRAEALGHGERLKAEGIIGEFSVHELTGTGIPKS
jgi:cell division septation protein DedD